MATDYRAVRLEEEAETMNLWVKVFNVPEGFFRSILEVEEDRSFDQTRVAVIEERIVSALQVFYIPTRGVDGRLHKMGGIANVGTYEDARQQGHSGRLLVDVIAQMEKDGCVWSLLFTGTNKHYARYGWKTITTHAMKGVIRTEASYTSDRYVVSKLDDVKGAIPALKKVHDAFDANRPLTMVRSQRAWETAVYFRMGPESGAVVFVARENDEMVAYAVVKPNDKEFQVVEVACLDGKEEALKSIFESVRLDGLANGIEVIFALLPEEPLVSEALEMLAKDMVREDHGHVMARPIGDRMTMEEVEALFEAPGAIFWELDHF